MAPKPQRMSIDPSDPTALLEINNGTVVNISSGFMKCLQFDYYMSFAIIVSMVSCFVGNGLALATFSRWNSVEGRSPAVFLFQEMAVCDMLVMLPVIFVTVYPSLCVLRTTYSGVCKEYCQNYLAWMVKFLWPVSSIAQVSATWLTILKAFSRYQAVCAPPGAPRGEKDPMRTVYIQVTASWVLSFFYNLPRFFEFEVIEVSLGNETIHTYKNTPLSTDTTYQVVYLFISSLLLVNVIPVIILTVLVVKLYRTLSPTQNEEERSFTVMMIVIVVIFLVTQGPASINRLLLSITRANTCGHFVFYLTRLCNLLVYINSSIPIYIYAASLGTFRLYLRSLFTRNKMCCCRTAPNLKNSFRLADSSVTSGETDTTIGEGYFRSHKTNGVHSICNQVSQTENNNHSTSDTNGITSSKTSLQNGSANHHGYSNGGCDIEQTDLNGGPIMYDVYL